MRRILTKPLKHGMLLGLVEKGFPSGKIRLVADKYLLQNPRDRRTR